GVGNAITDQKAAHLRPDHIDHAGAFKADRGGKRFHRMDAASHEHIPVVDRDRDVADAHLSGAGGAHLELLEAQHVGPTVLIETKRLAHGASPFTKSEDLKARSARDRVQAPATRARSYCRCR